MDAIKLQDLINAAESLMQPGDAALMLSPRQTARLFPKLVEALKDIAPEVKCPECDGRGFLTGATACEDPTRGKCPDCKGTGQKYLLEV